MKIKRALGVGLNDYPGKIAAVLFTPSCNWKCPACHAKYIIEHNLDDSYISEQDVFDYLSSRKLRAVVLLGGEPTCQNGLIEFTRKLKQKNISVKLDTNGSNYAVLKELLEKKLVDYVAMDVKGPFKLYRNLTGQKHIDFRDDYMKGMVLTSQFPEYEYRTTVCPVIRDNGEISFLTLDEIVETAKEIAEVTGMNHHNYVIQSFKPVENGLIDSRLEKFKETPPQLLNEMKKEIIKYLPNCKIRGEYD